MGYCPSMLRHSRAVPHESLRYHHLGNMFSTARRKGRVGQYRFGGAGVATIPPPLNNLRRGYP
jgi:hypothetical protein